MQFRIERNTESVPQIRALQSRIRAAAAFASNAEIARRTGFNTETVRRYLGPGVPALPFILEVCAVWRLNANWLLFGIDPQHSADSLSEHRRAEAAPTSIGGREGTSRPVGPQNSTHPRPHPPQSKDQPQMRATPRNPAPPTLNPPDSKPGTSPYRTPSSQHTPNGSTAVEYFLQQR